MRKPDRGHSAKAVHKHTHSIRCRAMASLVSRLASLDITSEV